MRKVVGKVKDRRVNSLWQSLVTGGVQPMDFKGCNDTMAREAWKLREMNNHAGETRECT